MKKILLIFLLLCISVCSYCDVYSVKHINSKKLPKNELKYISGNKNVKTEWTVAYGNTGLYFTFYCYDNLKNLSENPSSYDTNVEKSDSVEIFLKPVWENEKANDYYHFILNCNNVHGDAYNKDFSQYLYWTSSVTKERNMWVANVFIPYCSLGMHKEKYLKIIDIADTNTSSCPLFPVMTINYNVKRNYHPGQDSEGVYTYFLSFDENKTETWGRLALPPYWQEKYFVNYPIIISKTKNKYKVTYPKNTEGDWTDEKITAFQIVDIDTGDVYSSINGECIINFKKKGIHKLVGVVYNGDFPIAHTQVFRFSS